MSLGSFAKDAGKAVVRGAAQGGGLISAPFRAVKTGANTISGIKKNITGYYHPKKKNKSRFKPKATNTNKPYITPPPLPKANANVVDKPYVTPSPLQKKK